MGTTQKLFQSHDKSADIDDINDFHVTSSNTNLICLEDSQVITNTPSAESCEHSERKFLRTSDVVTSLLMSENSKNPDITAWDLAYHSTVYGYATPECNFSCAVQECELNISESPVNGNPTTPNLSDINDSLDHKAIPFIPGKLVHHLASNIVSADNIYEDLNSDKESPHAILQNLRLKNVDKIIVGHININSIRNKIQLLADMITGKVDILLISETKLDSSFPMPQFFLPGFSEPRRLDRTSNGGGLLLYLRDDIPAKPLPIISGNIECIIQEINISKKKWVLFGIYNPMKSQISSYLSILQTSLSHYLSSYDNVLIFGDFNSEIGEDDMCEFCSLYDLKSLIKVPTCYKSTDNPSCIDLILTNRPHNFQYSTVLETGLSDFHLLTLTVLKTTYRKRPPKIIRYRNYKNYIRDDFQHDLFTRLAGIDLHNISNDEYVALLMEILNYHAPLKTKYLRANEQPFMSKELRKAHMKRSRLRNKYRKNKNDISEVAFKKQRNYCVSLLKKVKKSYFGKLQPSSICDNKMFWKTVKPIPSLSYKRIFILLILDLAFSNLLDMDFMIFLFVTLLIFRPKWIIGRLQDD